MTMLLDAPIHLLGTSHWGFAVHGSDDEALLGRVVRETVNRHLLSSAIHAVQINVASFDEYQQALALVRSVDRTTWPPLRWIVRPSNQLDPPSREVLATLPACMYVAVDLAAFNRSDDPISAQAAERLLVTCTVQDIGSAKLEDALRRSVQLKTNLLLNPDETIAVAALDHLGQVTLQVGGIDCPTRGLETHYSSEVRETISRLHLPLIVDNTHG